MSSYCTAAGGLAQNVDKNAGGFFVNDDCIEHCVCYDTGPAPPKANRIINIDGSATCNGAAVVPFIEATPVANTLVTRSTDLDLDTKTLLPRHSYAMICGFSSGFTTGCASSPFYYYCNAAGALAQNTPNGDPDISQNQDCIDSCVCYDLNPAPPKAHCIVNIDGSAQCSASNSKEVVTLDAADFAALETLGVSVSSSSSTTAARRNANSLLPRHAYAMICSLSTREINYCASAPFFYYCTKSGSISQNWPTNGPHVISDTCDLNCECLDINPEPVKAHCIYSINGSVTCTNKANGKEFMLDAADFAALEASDLPIVSVEKAVAMRDTKTLLTRHAYALICALSARETNFCAAAPLFYYCTGDGALAQNFPKGAPIVINDACEEQCDCLDINPGPPKVHCIYSIDGSVTCTNKVNGKEFLLDADDFAALEATGVSVSVGTAAVARSIDPAPKTNILLPRHNYAMICGLSPAFTRACSSSPYFCYCTQNDKLEQNLDVSKPHMANDLCTEGCICYDFSPGPPKANCIVNIDGSATCNGKVVDAAEFAALVASGTNVDAVEGFFSAAGE